MPLTIANQAGRRCRADRAFVRSMGEQLAVRQQKQTEAAAAALPAAAAANVFFLLSILGPPRLTSFRLGLATKPLVDPAFFDAGCGAFFFVLS